MSKTVMLTPRIVIGLAEPLETSPFVRGLQEEARRYSVWVSVGVHEAPPASPSSGNRQDNGPDKRCYNTQCLIDPTGNIASAYRKLHLFDVDIQGGSSTSESDTTRKGEALPKVTETEVGKGKSLTTLSCSALAFTDLRMAQLECSLAMICDSRKSH